MSKKQEIVFHSSLITHHSSLVTVMIAKMKARKYRCSFCGRSQGEVGQIVAGAPQASRGVPRGMVGKSAFICDECVMRCNRIIAGQESTNALASSPK
jgi:ClpX C4-type zinc finger